MVQCDPEKINVKHWSQTLSIVLGIDIKTRHVKDFYVFKFFVCGTFKTPIMPWVNWTPSVQRGPKSERNTSVLYEPHEKQRRWETTTLESGTDGGVSQTRHQVVSHMSHMTVQTLAHLRLILSLLLPAVSQSSQELHKHLSQPLHEFASI